jgi:hypothetical protein
MNKPAHVRVSDLHGFGRLAVDATLGLTDLVEAMHHTILRTPGPIGKAPAGRTRGITGFVYRSVRGVTRLVGASVDTALGRLAPLLAERPSSGEREAMLAALNGVLGDYLAASGNPLAIPMRLRSGGVALSLARPALAAALPGAGPKLLVMVHGLCMNDLQWRRDGHDHGAALARDLGYTPVCLHYNSGLHIAHNGRAFADVMQTLVQAWPGTVDEIAIVGHSMGGLVARSAVHYATRAGHAWTASLAHLVAMGTPHLGAPLERAGAVADYLIGISPYSAPFARLGKLRSAGVKDLRYGNLVDGEASPGGDAHAHAAHVHVPLPDGVRCHAIAASLQARPASARSRLRGDGLVPVRSALGEHRDPALTLAFPARDRFIAYETGHFDLLGSAAAYDRIRGWLARDADVTA